MVVLLVVSLCGVGEMGVGCCGVWVVVVLFLEFGMFLVFWSLGGVWFWYVVLVGRGVVCV